MTASRGRRLAPPRTLLPALIFVIVVTQIPFVFTLYYSTQSWNLVRPDSRAFVGLDNYVAVFGDSQFWRVTVNTILLIVGTVLVSVILGLIFALLLDRKFLGRGVVRTLLITPFLVTPVAAALLWKTSLLSPTNGLVNWALSPLRHRDRLALRVSADERHGRIGLAVDAVHDAAHPRRAAVDAA